MSLYIYSTTATYIILLYATNAAILDDIMSLLYRQNTWNKGSKAKENCQPTLSVRIYRGVFILHTVNNVRKLDCKSVRGIEFLVSRRPWYGIISNELIVDNSCFLGELQFFVLALIKSSGFFCWAAQHRVTLGSRKWNLSPDHGSPRACGWEAVRLEALRASGWSNPKANLQPYNFALQMVLLSNVYGKISAFKLKTLPGNRVS